MHPIDPGSRCDEEHLLDERDRDGGRDHRRRGGRTHPRPRRRPLQVR